MNLDHDFVQVWKFSGNQKKKSERNTFSPNSGEDQKKVFIKNRTLFFHQIQVETKKKRSSTRIENFFPQIYAQMYTHSNYWGMQGWTILKLLGGIQPNYWGDISPHSPLFSAPLSLRLQLIICHKKELLSSLSSIKLVLIRNKCYQCKLVCSGTMNEWCKILTIKTLTEVTLVS